RRRAGEYREAARQLGVAQARPWGVDEDEALLQLAEQGRERLEVLRRVDRSAQELAEREHVILRAEPDVLCRHQRQVACPVPQYPPDRELRQGHRLADAG